MHRLETGSACVGPLHPQGSTATAPRTGKRRKSLRKFGVATLQLVIVLMGSLLAITSARASTQFCSLPAKNTWGWPTPGATPVVDYTISIYAVPSSLLQGNQNCVTWYAGTNYLFTWNLTQSGEDFIPSVGHQPSWNVPIATANTSAKAWHNHLFTSGNTGRSYFGLYGKTTKTVEWYIIDDWYGPQPYPAPGQSTNKYFYQGSFQSDGGTYNVWQAYNTGGYEQWWSVRSTPRTSGYISYVNHMQEWVKMGMPAGDSIDYTYFIIEANEIGQGSLAIYSVDLSSYPPN